MCINLQFNYLSVFALIIFSMNTTNFAKGHLWLTVLESIAQQQTQFCHWCCCWYHLCLQTLLHSHCCHLCCMLLFFFCFFPPFVIIFCSLQWLIWYYISVCPVRFLCYTYSHVILNWPLEGVKHMCKRKKGEERPSDENENVKELKSMLHKYISVGSHSIVSHKTQNKWFILIKFRLRNQIQLTDVHCLEPLFAWTNTSFTILPLNSRRVLQHKPRLKPECLLSDLTKKHKTNWGKKK